MAGLWCDGCSLFPPHHTHRHCVCGCKFVTTQTIPLCIFCRRLHFSLLGDCVQLPAGDCWAEGKINLKCHLLYLVPDLGRWVVLFHLLKYFISNHGFECEGGKIWLPSLAVSIWRCECKVFVWRFNADGFLCFVNLKHALTGSCSSVCRRRRLCVV